MNEQQNQNEAAGGPSRLNAVLGVKEIEMVEVGVVKAHPLVMMYKHCKTVFRTWMFARKHGIPCNEWYGVYEAGTETVVAHMGCTALAKGFAHRLATAENEWRSRNQESA